MELINHNYSNIALLKETIASHNITDDETVLIQLFYSNQDTSTVQTVRDELKLLLPNVPLIATSTSGVISEGRFRDDVITVSFSLFKASTTKAIGYHSKNIDEIINDLEFQCITENTKVLIAFTNTYTFDSTLFIEKLGEKFPNIALVGGNAGDDYHFKECELFTNKEDHCDVVVASIDSKQLEVQTKYLFNWQTLGREMIVTKSEDIKVYEIDKQPAMDVFRYYLGDDVADNLMTLGIEFPLVFNKDGVSVARSLVTFDKNDGSISFAGKIPEGSYVKFSYANVKYIQTKNREMLLNEFSHKQEAMYIYSCGTRRQVLGTFLNEELNDLNRLATSVGFMTYGEFFHDGASAENDLLNMTTTYLVLNESSQDELFSLDEDDVLKDKRDDTLKAVTNLLFRTNSELKDKVELLQDTQNQLIESDKMASLGALVSGIAHEVNTPLGVGLTGISQISYEVKELKKAYEAKKLTESFLTSYMDKMEKLSKTIQNGLTNAVNLVKSFKHISVDQHSDESRVFNLSDYLDETIISLGNVIKQKRIDVQNDVDKSIEIDSYPGVFAQIFSNLIMNSDLHAFSGQENNKIEIYADSSLPLTIHYKDNGKGIDPSIENKIFDPFFTTARGEGGSGLGLNIVYNLVTQKLNGKIEILRDGEGLHFVITIGNQDRGES